VRGWSDDELSDSSKIRALCVKHMDIDILGIAESHLVSGGVINMAGYTWLGQNRAKNRKAWTGSGGVGFLIKDNVRKLYNINIKDSNSEGILWIQLKGKSDGKILNLCVCYLPPEGSSCAVDPHSFFGELLTQVYSYQHEGPFFIMGDLNSRCANSADFIEGVDEIQNRKVIDTQQNQYGEFMCDFFISASCCIMNGRNCIDNNNHILIQDNQ
jgi:hypothetical protein